MLCFGLLISPLANPRGAISRRVTQRYPPTATARERHFWVEPREKSVLTTALENGVEKFLFGPHAEVSKWSHLGRFDAVTVRSDGTFEGGLVSVISSPDDVASTMSLAGSNSIVIIDPKDWKAIPAENIIAAYQDTPTKLFAVVRSAEEAESMLGMLEVGVDGVVLRTSQPSEVRHFCELRDEMVGRNTEDNNSFSVAVVMQIRQVGVGERVCLDTCSILAEDEGLFVGSSSKAMFQVLSEAAKVDYISSRPFRVNAGSVHSYCLVPGYKTKYLSELTAGDDVLVFGKGGHTCRKAVVGRSKIETRPLCMITARLDDTDQTMATIFVQNAETVRLAAVGADGKSEMTSVTRLQQGDKLLARTEEHARHIGMAITENIVEK